jgi:DNA modification methylase
MAGWPSNSIDLIVTSPPYWDAVTYAGDAATWHSYQAYLDDLLTVWIECARVLRPNGKLVVNAMAMPIPQRLLRQETRVLKNIPGDIWHGVVNGTDLRFHEEFVWQKQTSKHMFGAGQRPRPGNNIANNTTERITVYVKPGKPRKFAASVVAANEIDPAIKRDLAQQVWCMIPARNKEHRAPFPERLPARLIRLFAMGASDFTDEFPGEVVLDPFVGTGTTCVAAKRMGLRWIGIDRVPKYAAMARANVERAQADGGPDLRVGFSKSPKIEPEVQAGATTTKLGSIGRELASASTNAQPTGRSTDVGSQRTHRWLAEREAAYMRREFERPGSSRLGVQKSGEGLGAAAAKPETLILAEVVNP